MVFFLSPSILSCCVPFCHYDEIPQQINSKETWFILQVSNCEYFYPIIVAHGGRRAWRADLFWPPNNQEEEWEGMAQGDALLLKSQHQ